MAVDEAELAPVMRIVRQGIEAQLRDPAFEYSNRVKLVSLAAHEVAVPRMTGDRSSSTRELCQLRTRGVWWIPSAFSPPQVQLWGCYCLM